MAPPLPMVPCKARAIVLGGAAVGSLVLGAETQPIKKQRGGRGLGLRWLPFGLGKHNNQPKIGVCCGEDIGEGVRPGCVGGAFRYRLGRRKEDEEINNEKYIVAFGGL